MITPIALSLIAGIGVCSHSGEWCNTPPVKVGVVGDIRVFNIDWRVSLTHTSKLNDGRPFRNKRGDRGFEMLMLEREFKLTK